MAQVGIARPSGAPVWVVAVVALAALAAGWVGHGLLAAPPPAADAPPAAAPAEPEAAVQVPTAADCDPTEAAALRTDVAALEAQLSKLTLRLEEEESARREAEGQLAGAIAEARRYKQGAEAAVDELNRQARRRPSPRGAPSAAVRSGSSTEDLLAHTPQLVISGDNVIVSGKIWNAGTTAQRIQLTIELQLDGRTVDSAYKTLTCAERVETPYSHRFNGVREGQYTVNLRIQ